MYVRKACLAHREAVDCLFVFRDGTLDNLFALDLFGQRQKARGGFIDKI